MASSLSASQAQLPQAMNCFRLLFIRFVAIPCKVKNCFYLMGVARFRIPAKRSFDNAYPLVVNSSFLLEPTRQRARGGRKDSWKGLQQNRLHRSSFFLCQNLKLSIGMEMLAWPPPVLFINPEGVAPDKANKYRTLISFPYCSVLFSRWWHKNLQLPTLLFPKWK